MMPQLCWGSEMDFGVVIPTILSQEAWFWGMSIQMRDSQNPLGIGEFNRCSMVTLNQPLNSSHQSPSKKMKALNPGLPMSLSRNVLKHTILGKLAIGQRRFKKH